MVIEKNDCATQNMQMNLPDHVEQKKPDTKEHMLSDCIYVKFKNKQSGHCGDGHQSSGDFWAQAGADTG